MNKIRKEELISIMKSISELRKRINVCYDSEVRYINNMPLNLRSAPRLEEATNAARYCYRADDHLAKAISDIDSAINGNDYEPGALEEF